MMLKKSQILYSVVVSRFGYGKGFWTLLAGIAVAFAVLVQFESRQVHPIVERIPASDSKTR